MAVANACQVAVCCSTLSVAIMAATFPIVVPDENYLTISPQDQQSPSYVAHYCRDQPFGPSEIEQKGEG
jgi:hypothetical protein